VEYREWREERREEWRREGISGRQRAGGRGQTDTDTGTGTGTDTDTDTDTDTGVCFRVIG
jgi:hypothetical protein